MTLKLKSLSSIYSAVNTAWYQTVEDIDAAMTLAIEDPRYSWPRGESPRDIVDTHALAESQHVDRVGTAAKFSWGDSQVDYAIAVHEGEENKPARRWTREAIKGDENAPLEWQNPRAILNVPTAFTQRFRANYRE
jgi:hypothetical protein